MSDKTFHVTGEDVRKLEAQEGKAHGGEISKDSNAAILKSVVAENTDQDRAEKVRQDLPLPEQPLDGKAPPPDFNSADGRLTNVGSGGVNVKLGTQSSNGLREPATAESSVRVDPEELKTQAKP